MITPSPAPTASGSGSGPSRAASELVEPESLERVAGDPPSESAGGPLVRIEELGKSYGSFQALADCSFQIEPGEIFGLLGPNGAGKTTLLRCLLGFIRATRGRATIGGYDCWSQRTAAHRLLTYLPAQPQLPRLLRGRDVLRFFADIRPDGPDGPGGRVTAAARHQQALGLADRLQLDLSRWVALMSTGMRQKLALAAALSAALLPGDVPLVFLDEPTANLDPDVRSQLLQELSALRRQGKTVVFSSHVLSEIEEICDRVAVLAKGRLVGISEIKQLQESSLIRGRRQDGHRQLPIPEPVRWTEEGRFEFQTDRPLPAVLSILLPVGLAELKVQPLGLLDVYHQHLTYVAGPADGSEKVGQR